MEHDTRLLLKACAKAHGVDLPTDRQAKHTWKQLRVYHSAAAIAIGEWGIKCASIAAEYGWSRSPYGYTRKILRERPDYLKLDECRAEYARMKGVAK